MFIGMAIKGSLGFSFRAGSEEVKFKLHNGQVVDEIIPQLVEYQWYQLDYRCATMEIHSIFDISAQKMIWQSDE